MPMQEVDEDFLATFEIDLVAGRSKVNVVPLEPSDENRRNADMLLTESAVQMLEWEDPGSDSGAGAVVVCSEHSSEGSFCTRSRKPICRLSVPACLPSSTAEIGSSTANHPSVDPNVSWPTSEDTPTESPSPTPGSSPATRNVSFSVIGIRETPKETGLSPFILSSSSADSLRTFCRRGSSRSDTSVSLQIDPAEPFSVAADCCSSFYRHPSLPNEPGSSSCLQERASIRRAVPSATRARSFSR